MAPELVLTLTFEHDTSGVAQKDAWVAETPKLVRLEFQGTAPADITGATYSFKTLHIDMAGKWENFEPLGEQDGNDVLTGTFRGRYDLTSTSFAQFLVVNELTVLP